MADLCLGDLQFSASTANLLGSDVNGRVFKGTFKGELVAVKQLSVNSADSQISSPQDEQHWEKLIKLRCNNLVQYLQCSIQDDIRYLVMELCQGSMLDYCRETLDKSVASHVKAIDVMWQITCGLDYLHRQKINHGNLKLGNVLFWKRDPKSRRIVAKLAGYGCKDAKTDLFQLGCLFYSAATKEEAEPNGSVPLDSLTEIDDNGRALALDLISLLVNGSLSNNVEAGTVLRHPLFTRCTDEGRSRLTQDLMDDKVGLMWNDKEKMRKWLESMDESKFPDEDFGDFKDILLNSETKGMPGEAFNATPQLFSEYIWYISLDPVIGSGYSGIAPKGNNKTNSIKIHGELGKGTYGKVYKCEYTDGNRIVSPAACKKCNPIRGAEEVFNREIETLRKLNHLFVVRYLNVVEKDDSKFIVMELCEGSLKDYVEGKLESIPKDSLDDKIIISQITLGLAYIHDKGIIHKDLKLENILLKRYSPRLVFAKIADFGFAKELKPGKLEFSETEHPGTPTYMAPELLNAPEDAYPASFASDVYALGITIARIVLKGAHPFSNNKIWRKVFMINGLVPQNLEGLSWDLIDLILKLTDTHPGKRPNMLLVLIHPYFVLTNDRTKRHFVDQFFTSFQALITKENNEKQMRKIFNNRNFREWYETLSRDKVDSDDEIEEMTKNLKIFSSFLGSDVNADTFYPTKEYDQTIKEAITSEYDANIGNKITQMSGIATHYGNISRYRLYKLIKGRPKLLVPYFWSRLQELDESFSPVASVLETTDNKSTGRKRRQSGQRKVSVAPQHRRRIISEIEWMGFYYGDEELVIDELWNIKYTESYKESPEIVEETIKTAVKCNVSERVLSALLDRIEDEFRLKIMLIEAVQSYAPNAPKVTDMILDRCDKVTVKERMSLFYVPVLVAARNEGDWADKIMYVLLKHGGLPNFVDKNGYSPAHYAAINESHLAPKIITLLLQYGANPNIRSIPDGITPIHMAARNRGDYAAEILKHLLDSGGDCKAVVETSLIEPIHLATLNSGDSALEMLNLFLEKRGINVILDDGRTLLHLAMMNEGDCGPTILKKLLASGVNPNVPDKKKLTPLHQASGRLKLENQNLALMKDLIENGGDPNAVDEHGLTPVHYAAADGEHGYEKLKLLFDYKGNVSINDKYGLTPLHCAIWNKGNSGTETRENTRSDESKQSIATKNNQMNRIQLILDNDGNPNAQDSLGRTPVHLAVIKNELEILQLLFKKGGNPNLLDTKQCAPIHYAAHSISETAPGMVKLLLECGGDANLNGDKDEYTPLHAACLNSEIHGPTITRILLENGGNPNALDLHKRTPLHFAIQKKQNDQLRLDTIKLLLEKGGNPNAGDKEGRTSVHYVVKDNRSNSLRVLKLLLEHGGNILQGSNNGASPHLEATQKGNKQYCHPEVKKHIIRTYRKMK